MNNYVGHLSDILSQTLHFRFVRGFALIFVLARVELIYDVECHSAAVILLTFVNKYAIRVHCPVIIGCVEYVGGSQSYVQ